MNTPRFTVIIPTCRRNETLDICLQRLTSGRQVLPASEFEIIVSDDGPPEDNARLLVEYTYPTVRWLEGPRRGPAANRNHGAAQARGEWLVFTDDDCKPRRKWLSAYAARIAEGLGDCRVLEGYTGDGGEPLPGPFHMVPGNDSGGLLWSCNFAIERRLFEQMGGFDEGFPYPHLEDVDLRLRLEDAREKYLFVPEARVEHPPRPIGSARKWVLAQESSFYLAHKRGVSLAAVNFGPGTYARGSLRSFRSAHGLKERGRVAWRIVEELSLLSLYLPRWLARYGKGRVTGSPN